MKMKKLIRLFTSAMVIALAGSQLYMSEVRAGSSDYVIDANSLKEGIDSSKWNVPNDDINVEKGTLIFTNESTADTKLITVDGAKKSPYNEELFKAQYKIKFKSLPEGQQFAAAFALKSIESIMQDAGNVEIVFENKGGIAVSVYAYDEEGKTIVLANTQTIGIALNNTFSLDVTATTDNRLTVKVNGKKIYDGVTEVALEGRIGFLQTGSCAAEIQDVNIVSHAYDRPENAKIEEDFELGTMDYNTVTSKMITGGKYYPNGIQVETYDGSRVLMFRNVNAGYFGTKHQYSNFEVSFDVPYIAYMDEVNENGVITAAKHTAFVLGIGDDAVEYNTHGYVSSTEGVVFTPTSVASLTHLTDTVIFAEDKYGNPETNAGYSVKVTMIDAELTVYMKALHATKYDKVMQYRLGNITPLGYLHIFTNGQSHFAIDNFKIINKDQDANLLELEYKESLLKGTEDWVYEPMEKVYLEPEDAGQEMKWIMMPICSGVTGSLILIACIAIRLIRKRQSLKGAGKHEE